MEQVALISGTGLRKHRLKMIPESVSGDGQFPGDGGGIKGIHHEKRDGGFDGREMEKVAD
jgi:hypothetical protein